VMNEVSKGEEPVQPQVPIRDRLAVVHPVMVS
jgi:hypothetical protein